MPELTHADKHHRNAGGIGFRVVHRPPGWMAAVTPASITASRPSANGKNASEASTELTVGSRGSPASLPHSAALALQ
jgi:hypothetical protein